MTHPGISIYYSPQDGGDWARYIQEKLDAPEYNIITELNEFTSDTTYHTPSSKANLFLISPDVLALPAAEWQLMKNFDTKTSMIILVGIDHADLVFAAERSRISSIIHWLCIEIEAAEDSVREMLMLIIGMYEDVQVTSPFRDSISSFDALVPSATSSRTSLASSGDGEDRIYDRLPSRGKLRQVNQLNHVFQKGDDVFLILERPAEGDLEMLAEGRTGAIIPKLLEGKAVYHVPKQLCQTRFTLLLDDKDIGSGVIADAATHVDDSQLSDKQARAAHNVEPVTSPSHLPTPCSTPNHQQSVSYQSSHGADIQSGTKLELLREILESETEPENTLCECLGIEKDTRRLDEALTAMVSYMDTLKRISFNTTAHKPPEHTDAVWPTLLHFGAHYNLQSFCYALLSNHIMRGYCVTPNKDGDLPEDIARKAGHTKLADLLSNYVKPDKHDSGFSRFSDLTLHEEDLGEDSPPRPHSTSSDTSDDFFTTGYLNIMSSVMEPNTPTEAKPPPRPPRLGSARSDSESSQGHSFDDETFPTPTNMVAPPELKAEVADQENVYYNCLDDDRDPLDVGRTSFYVPHPSPSATGNLSQSIPRNFPSRPSELVGPTSGRDATSPRRATSREGSTVYRHKNLTSYMGLDNALPLHTSRSVGANADSVFIDTKNQSVTHKLKFWKKKKDNRSNSEPTIAEEHIAAIISGPNAKKYTRSPSDVQRTSDTSSSSSTYSEKTLSTLMQDAEEEEDSSIQTRGKTAKKKNKKRLKFFKSDIEKRKSLRITKVMEDHNLTAPSLPPRRKNQQF